MGVIDRMESAPAYAGTYNNNVSPAGEAEGRDKTKLAAWVGVMPLQSVYDVSKPPPILFGEPWWNFKFATVSTAAAKGFGYAGVGARYFDFYLFERRKVKNIFVSSLTSFEQTAAATLKPTLGYAPKLSYVMGYTQWHDGWNYQPFSRLYCDICYAMGKTPVITWQLRFKRKYVLGNEKMYFLDEFNAQLTDEGSELYRYAAQFLEEAGDCAEKHNGQLYLRFLHEMNLDFGYDWTGFMNGGGEDKISYVLDEKSGWWVKKEGEDGIPDGPQRVTATWKNLYRMVQERGKGRVKLIWCPEAHPEIKAGSALEKATWNTFENYYPGDEYVDMIGFDVYQRQPEPFESFGALFSKADAFIRSVQARRAKRMPVSICEASTKPESYRGKYIKDIFKYGNDNGLEFICWFNENKEADFRIDANIVTASRVEQVAEAQTEAERLAALMRVKKEGKKKPEAVNGGAEKTSSTIYEASQTEKNEMEMIRDEFGLQDVPLSFNKAFAQWRIDKKRRGQNFNVKWLSGIESVFAMYSRPAGKLKMASDLGKIWTVEPGKYNEKGGAGLRLALKMLDENLSDKFIDTEEYVLSLIEKEKLLAKYSQIFLVDMGVADTEGSDINEDLNPPQLAMETCERILGLLYGSSYLVEMKRCLENRDCSLADSIGKKYSVNNARYRGGYISKNPGKFSDEKIIGLEAEAYALLADIYMCEGVRDIEKAERLYLFARKKIEEKDAKGIRERFWNVAIDIGLTRIRGFKGIQAGSKNEAIAAINALAGIVSSEEDIDTGLRIKARFCLAELLQEYGQTEALDTKDGLARARKIAYSTYRELLDTELTYMADVKMKEIVSEK